MKPTVIVTIQAQGIEGGIDIEAPTDVPVKQLAGDIAEQINGYLGKDVLRGKGMTLRCERLNQRLQPDETFARAGIWNGDIIWIQ